MRHTTINSLKQILLTTMKQHLAPQPPQKVEKHVAVFCLNYVFMFLNNDTFGSCHKLWFMAVTPPLWFSTKFIQG